MSYGRSYPQQIKNKCSYGRSYPQQIKNKCHMVGHILNSKKINVIWEVISSTVFTLLIHVNTIFHLLFWWIKSVIAY